MPFTFKQFHINDDLCGMRVSTDAVLLGAWATLPDGILQGSEPDTSSTETQSTNMANIPTTPKGIFKILDIGSGSGILSLMAAQRTTDNVHISAIEIDAQAVKQSKDNIAASPWPQKISVIEGSLQQVSETLTQQFDHILCNPPYFANGPQADNNQRATARHTDSLAFDTLLKAVDKLLAPTAQANFILPLTALTDFITALSQTSMTLVQRINVATVEHKSPTRMLLTLEKTTLPAARTKVLHPIEAGQKLHIQDKNGQYSQQMINLCRDFYLKL